MGDYSTTFHFKNLLNVPLVHVRHNASIGYWIRVPDIIIAPGTESPDMQIKDKAGPYGTDGTITYMAKVNMTEVMINIYAACPYGLVYKPENQLSITFEPKGLLQCSVEGFGQSHNPSIFSLIIQPTETSQRAAIIEMPSADLPKRPVQLCKYVAFEWLGELAEVHLKRLEGGRTKGRLFEMKHFGVTVGDYCHELHVVPMLYNTYQYERKEDGVIRWNESVDVGYTTLSDQQIVDAGRAAIQAMDHGYNLLTNNCQTFARGLLCRILNVKMIRQAGVPGVEEALYPGPDTAPTISSEAASLTEKEKTVVIERADRIMMGDYSSTFTIHSGLDVGLRFVEKTEKPIGYWLRQPDRGIMDHDQPNQIQLKDRAGVPGTDGTVKYKASICGQEVQIAIRVACPADKDNIASITSTNEDLVKVSMGPMDESKHPLIMDFYVNPA